MKTKKVTLTGFFLLLIFVFSYSYDVGAVSFEITAPKTKIGDTGDAVYPTCSPGMHNIVASGNEVYAAYSIQMFAEKTRFVYQKALMQD